MDLRDIYLTTTFPEIPGIINYNNDEIHRYLDIIYSETDGVVIVPINTPGNVKAATAEFVNLVVDNLRVRSQYTNLYENITTANYDYYITNLGISAPRRDPSLSAWENPDCLYIDVQKPYYKLIPDNGPGDYTALKTDLKSQFVQLIFDPSGATTGTYTILLDPILPIDACSYLVVTIDSSLREDQQTKWASLICTNWDASYGPTWEVYDFGNATAGGAGGGGGVDSIWVNDRIAYELLHYAYDPSLADSVTMPAAVGGLPAGTTAGSLRGQTYEQIITRILFATVLAYIYTYNSATLGGVTTATAEVGSSYAPTGNAGYDRGIIYNGNGTAGPVLTANPSEYTFKLPDGTIDASIPNTGYSQLHAYTAYDISFGSNIWSVTVAYYAGTGAYYDNKGNAGTNLNASRVAGSVSANSSVITGRRYVWYGYGTQGSDPSTSTLVRALSDKLFLSATDTITFDISIPAATQKAYFFIPIGKTVKVELVESSYADITGDFVSGPITVNDAAVPGNPQLYESWVHFIGLSGYASDVTYRVTVT